MLPAKKDVWGNDIERNSTGQLLSDITGTENNEVVNVTGRLLDNFLNPATIKKSIETRTDEELKDLFGSTGEKVLPTQKTLDKTIKINKQDYKLTSEEYNKSKEVFGKTAKELIDTFINSNGYKTMNNDEKAEMINKIYSYAKEEIKSNYAKEHNIEFTSNSTTVKDMFNTINAIKKAGGKAEDYINYLSGVKDIKEKTDRIKYLNNMNISQGSKDAIYQNDLSTYTFTKSGEDNHYNTLQKLNGGKVSSDYMNYLQQEFKADKNKKGNTISGSRAKKVREWLKNSNLSNIEMYYIYAKEGYACTKDGTGLNKTQRDKLRKALENNKLNLDQETYESMIKKLDEADANAKKWGVD